MTDPKIYTAPFSMGEVYFRWVPNQQLARLYLHPVDSSCTEEMGDSSGSDPDAATQGGRGGRPVKTKLLM